MIALTRRCWAALLLGVTVAALVVAVPAERPATAQNGPLRLAPHYEVLRVDSPQPATSGNFGGNIQNAGDLDGDGVDDILAPENVGDGLVRVIGGATGAHVYTVQAPDPGTEGSSAQFGAMVGRVADLGSCPGGSPGEQCALGAVGAGDAVPEFVVGAYRVKVGDADRIGRAYVYDGATGALLKRLQMPPADLASEAAIAPSLRPFSFGRSVLSPYSDYPADAPPAVKLGDMNGGGLADIVVGNSSFYEEGPSTNPACSPGPCNGAGRVYFFAGEDIAGSDPAEILDAPFKTVRNPEPRTDDPFYQGFGHTLVAIGDVGGCDSDPGAGQQCPSDASSSAPNGRANVVVSHIRADHDQFVDAGRAWLLDGTTGAVLRRLDHPQPQTGGLFSYTQAYGAAIGNVAGTAHPDIILSSADHDFQFANQGRAWVFNGNHRASSTLLVLSQLDDPQPKHFGYFGIPVTAIGDVHGDPYNEVLIGNVAFFGGDPSATIIGSAYIWSPATAELVRVIDDPDQRPGSAFGGGLASLGDTNGDGLVDFAVGAPRLDGEAGLSQGRLYIFHSAPEPEPDPPSADPEGALRLSGSDRVETAVAVSRDQFADRSVQAAVVARADDFADALAAGPFAVKVGGPVLLTGGDQLSGATASELQRILGPDGVVYVLGGREAVGDQIEDAIRALGYETRRIFGPTRVETAIALSRAQGNPETLLITTGFNFPDALTASAAAVAARATVLLTTPDAPHPSLDAYLAERPQAQLLAVGGPAARAYPAATAVFGATRDETAIAVAERFFDNPAVVGLARRDDFPDALSGGPHIGALGGPMLLTAVSGVHAATVGYLCAEAPSIRTAYIYGGQAVVSDRVVSEVEARIRGEGC